MAGLLEQYWWLFVVALLIGVIVAWWIFAIQDSKRVPTTRRPDVLDEGAAPAARNQALIDAPPATAAEPVTPVGSSPAPAPDGDDLLLIKGVGPKLNALLQSLGVTSFGEIAGWSEEDIDRIDAQLGNFAGRIRRDGWIEQARYLAAGDMAGFEARFGKV
jgi:predicted flap endonuclease-1-like 5' DNA nuclease